MGALLLAAVAVAVVNEGVVDTQGDPAPVAQAAGPCEPGWGSGGRVGGGQMRVMVWWLRRASPRRPRTRVRWCEAGWDDGGRGT
jgi:hypothetical protein